MHTCRAPLLDIVIPLCWQPPSCATLPPWISGVEHYRSSAEALLEIEPPQAYGFGVLQPACCHEDPAAATQLLHWEREGASSNFPVVLACDVPPPILLLYRRSGVDSRRYGVRPCLLSRLEALAVEHFPLLWRYHCREAWIQGTTILDPHCLASPAWSVAAGYGHAK